MIPPPPIIIRWGRPIPGLLTRILKDGARIGHVRKGRGAGGTTGALAAPYEASVRRSAYGSPAHAL